MNQIIRTQSSNPDFQALVKELDKDLFERYPEIQSQYVGLNKVESINTIVIAYFDSQPVGCGCFKTFDPESVEIKRMFVKKDYRGKGISKLILNELETWAKELGFKKSILETGFGQPEAIGLYEKSGYKKVQNFGPYTNMSNSVCFGKSL
jgi:putative acetyltransferase